MRKLNLGVVLLFLLGVTMFIGCSKNENEFIKSSERSAKIKEIESSAVNFSRKHDSLVSMILQIENSIISTKSEKLKAQSVQLSKDEYFNIIEEVTGVKPIVVTKKNLDSDNIIINLDSEQIKLSEYVDSKIAKKYLSQVDALILNEELSISDLIKSIEKIQYEIKNDTDASLLDIEKVITATEVFKGSLLLWETQFSNDLKNIDKRRWSKWKKRLFVAAADAVGGALGFFTGAYVIWGVTLYIPPGPAGAVGGAAIFSAVAYQYASTK
jgi:hypothetical protein